MSEKITLSNEGTAAIITMHKGEDNAFNGPFLDEISESLNEVKKNDSYRTLIVTSSLEKSFCTGYDLGWWMQNAKAEGVLEAFFEKMNSMLKELSLFPKPVIAAINGHIFGQGIFFAGCMDYRIMRDDRGWVNLPEVNINIPFVPSQIAILREILPPASMRDMAFLGKKYSPIEAKELGFIDELTELAQLQNKALEKANEYSKVNAEAFAEIKFRIRKPLADIIEKDDIPYIKAALKKSRG
ncbi:MAG TPA: enoyl-CoA hydratase/isomerase family protein [Spirochaetota bacterium]|nr:enoyl-CoA hydratase/isomerase family protein [Spirochaetota bacterium]HPJ34822.1 enoyl-CoA hydratase/isomerase family protein [Spirochaetota bacterium]